MQYLGYTKKRQLLKYCQSLPAVLNDEGQLANDSLDRQRILLQHFAEQNNGSLTNLAQLVERIITRHQKASARNFDSKRIFTWLDIAQLFAKLKAFAAAGDDGVPTALLRDNRLQMARFVLPLYMKCTFLAVQPLQWHGARAKDLLKSGNPQLKENYRKIVIEGGMAPTIFYVK